MLSFTPFSTCDDVIEASTWFIGNKHLGPFSAYERITKIILVLIRRQAHTEHLF